MPYDRARRFAVIVFFITAMMSQTMADEVEHPAYTNWSKFPVGTKVTIKSTTSTKDRKSVVLTKTTLLRKDDKAIVISKKFETDESHGERSDDSVETTIKRFFPVLPGVDKSKIGKPAGNAGTGIETIEILGKSYEAEWYDSRANTEAGPSTTRTWISMEMPGQVIKSVSEVKAVGKMTVDEVVSIDIPGSN